MKDGKNYLGVFALGCSLIGGVLFSKHQYYKGKADAYEECNEIANEIRENMHDLDDASKELKEAD